MNPGPMMAMRPSNMFGSNFLFKQKENSDNYYNDKIVEGKNLRLNSH